MSRARCEPGHRAGPTDRAASPVRRVSPARGAHRSCAGRTGPGSRRAAAPDHPRHTRARPRSVHPRRPLHAQREHPTLGERPTKPEQADSLLGAITDVPQGQARVQGRRPARRCAALLACSRSPSGPSAISSSSTGYRPRRSSSRRSASIRSSTPSSDGAHAYALFVGAIQERKDPLAAFDAAAAAGLPLVAVGPEKDAALTASSVAAAPTFAATCRRRSWRCSTRTRRA